MVAEKNSLSSLLTFQQRSMSETANNGLKSPESSVTRRGYETRVSWLAVSDPFVTRYSTAKFVLCLSHSHSPSEAEGSH